MSTSNPKAFNPSPAPLNRSARAQPPAPPPPPPSLVRLPTTDSQPSLPTSSYPSPDLPQPLVYFDPRSAKACKLREELLKQTQNFSPFLTITLSNATHVVVEYPSILGDSLTRARASTSSSTSSPVRPRYILSLRWIEESIRTQHWQPEDQYLCVLGDSKEDETVDLSKKEEGRIPAMGFDVDPKTQDVPSSSSSAANTQSAQPPPSLPSQQHLRPTKLPHQPPCFLRFGVPPSISLFSISSSSSSSSLSSSSYCWLCGSQASKTNALGRMELAEPISSSTNSQEVSRFARSCCSECLGWFHSKILEGGEFVAGAKELGSMERLVWLTGKLKERGLEKRRERVKREEGGTAGRVEKERVVAPSIANISSVGPSITSSKRRPTNPSSLDPSSSSDKKARLYSSSSTNDASGSRPAAPLPPSRPSSSPPHPTSPSLPSTVTQSQPQSTTEPSSFLGLGAPPSSSSSNSLNPFCYFCGTNSLESSSFKTLDLAEEIPPLGSGRFRRVEGRLACEFCVERYETRVSNTSPSSKEKGKEREETGVDLKRLAVVTEMLKENGLRERRMLVFTAEEDL